MSRVLKGFCHRDMDPITIGDQISEVQINKIINGTLRSASIGRSVLELHSRKEYSGAYNRNFHYIPVCGTSTLTQNVPYFIKWTAIYPVIVNPNWRDMKLLLECSLQRPPSPFLASLKVQFGQLGANGQGYSGGVDIFRVYYDEIQWVNTFGAQPTPLAGTASIGENLEVFDIDAPIPANFLDATQEKLIGVKIEIDLVNVIGTAALSALRDSREVQHPTTDEIRWSRGVHDLNLYFNRNI